MENLIGNTPIVPLDNICNELGLKPRIFAKLEGFNPAGSIKDRVAYQIIADAEKKGLISEGATIIEPTSGNTGIGIAALCTTKNYNAVIVMPDTMSIERQKIIKSYGAELILTPGNLGMNGSIEKAEDLLKEIPNSIIAGQFSNPSNWKAHYNSTGPEIWKDMNGDIDALIACVGTGGTITGIGKYLNEMNSDIAIIGVEPATSNVLSGGCAGKHNIQGIGAGFIPEVLDIDILDGVITVSDQEAYNYARKIIAKEGVSVGISSGAALCAAVKYAIKNNNKKNIVIICPDDGSKYLSTELFDI